MSEMQARYIERELFDARPGGIGGRSLTVLRLPELAAGKEVVVSNLGIQALVVIGPDDAMVVVGPAGALRITAQRNPMLALCGLGL